MKFLIRPRANGAKGIAHIWVPSGDHGRGDTACRMWSTGGIHSHTRYSVFDDRRGRDVCQNCRNLYERENGTANSDIALHVLDNLNKPALRLPPPPSFKVARRDFDRHPMKRWLRSTDMYEICDVVALLREDDNLPPFRNCHDLVRYLMDRGASRDIVEEVAPIFWMQFHDWIKNQKWRGNER